MDWSRAHGVRSTNIEDRRFEPRPEDRRGTLLEGMPTTEEEFEEKLQRIRAYEEARRSGGGPRPLVGAYADEVGGGRGNGSAPPTQEERDRAATKAYYNSPEFREAEHRRSRSDQEADARVSLAETRARYALEDEARARETTAAEAQAMRDQIPDPGYGPYGRYEHGDAKVDPVRAWETVKRVAVHGLDSDAVPAEKPLLADVPQRMRDTVLRSPRVQLVREDGEHLVYQQRDGREIRIPKSIVRGG